MKPNALLPPGEKYRQGFGWSPGKTRTGMKRFFSALHNKAQPACSGDNRLRRLLLLLVLSLAMLHGWGQDRLSMVGAWEMTQQIASDGTKDSVLKLEQLKLYTDRYMMYASPRSSDSFGIYGIAKYRVVGDKVVENIFYTSSGGEVKDSAILTITMHNKGYRQVIDYSDANGKFLLIEDYKKVGKNNSTPLDGAWTQVKNINIDATGDTIHNKVVTQFKMYQSGYFIWANPSKDPASDNFVTAYGYGTFKMKGNDRCIETNTNSTYRDLVGRPVDIDIEILGPDAYKQTIAIGNGVRSVEVYERLK